MNLLIQWYVYVEVVASFREAIVLLCSTLMLDLQQGWQVRSVCQQYRRLHMLARRCYQATLAVSTLTWYGLYAVLPCLGLLYI